MNPAIFDAFCVFVILFLRRLASVLLGHILPSAELVSVSVSLMTVALIFLVLRRRGSLSLWRLDDVDISDASDAEVLTSKSSEPESEVASGTSETGTPGSDELSGERAACDGEDAMPCGTARSSGGMVGALHRGGAEKLGSGRSSAARCVVYTAAGYLFCLLVGGIVSVIIPSSPDDVAISVLAIVSHVLIAPIAEELLYRRAMLSALSFWGAVPAVVLSSLLFAVQHGSTAQMIYAFLCGAAFALITLKTKNVLPAVAVHILNNATVMIFSVILH